MFLPGTSFLFWLYIGKSCLMPQHSALQALFSYLQVDMHMPLCADWDHVSCRNRVGSMFSAITQNIYLQEHHLF